MVVASAWVFAVVEHLRTVDAIIEVQQGWGRRRSATRRRRRV
jgi:hypothetical protein